MDEGFNIFAGPETEPTGAVEPERRPAAAGSDTSELPVAAELELDDQDAVDTERGLFGDDSSRPRPHVLGDGRRGLLRTLALGAVAIVALALAGTLFGSGGRGNTDQRTVGPPAPTIPTPPDDESRHEPRAPAERSAARPLRPRRVPSAPVQRSERPKPVAPLDGEPSSATAPPSSPPALSPPPVPATAPQAAPALPVSPATREFGFER